MKIIDQVVPPPDGVTQEEQVMNRISGDYYVDHFKCYDCREEGEIQESKEHPHNKAPFCPRCGVRMVWICRSDNVSGKVVINQ